MKNIFIKIIPFILLVSCNNAEPTNNSNINISDVINGNWNFYYDDWVEVVNESGITDTVVLEKEYFEISFRENEMYFANIMGCSFPRLYRLKQDTIFFFYDTTDNQLPYSVQTIEYINDDALHFKSLLVKGDSVEFKDDTTEYTIHRISEPAYTLTDEMTYRNKYRHLTNPDEYMSALQNNPDNYNAWYQSRELLFGVKYGEIEKDKALKRINRILESDNLKNIDLRNYNKLVKKEIKNIKQP